MQLVRLPSRSYTGLRLLPESKSVEVGSCAGHPQIMLEVERKKYHESEWGTLCLHWKNVPSLNHMEVESCVDGPKSHPHLHEASWGRAFPFEYTYKWWRGNCENSPLPTVGSTFQCVKVDLPSCIDIRMCTYVLKLYSALFFFFYWKRLKYLLLRTEITAQRHLWLNHSAVVKGIQIVSPLFICILKVCAEHEAVVSPPPCVDGPKPHPHLHEASWGRAFVPNMRQLSRLTNTSTPMRMPRLGLPRAKPCVDMDAALRCIHICTQTQTRQAEARHTRTYALIATRGKMLSFAEPVMILFEVPTPGG